MARKSTCPRRRRRACCSRRGTTACRTRRRSTRARTRSGAGAHAPRGAHPAKPSQRAVRQCSVRGRCSRVRTHRCAAGPRPQQPAQSPPPQQAGASARRRRRSFSRTRRRSNQARRRSALRGNTHGPSSLSRTPPRCSRAPTSLCDESESWARVSNDGVRGARTCGSRGARQTLAGRGHMMRSVCIARTVAAGALAGGRVAPPVRAALSLLPRAPAHAAIWPVERCIALARALDARAAIRAVLRARVALTALAHIALLAQAAAEAWNQRAVAGAVRAIGRHPRRWSAHL